jgi:hypothetical protein
MALPAHSLHFEERMLAVAMETISKYDEIRHSHMSTACIMHCACQQRKSVTKPPGAKLQLMSAWNYILHLL